MAFESRWSLRLTENRLLSYFFALCLMKALVERGLNRKQLCSKCMREGLCEQTQPTNSAQFAFEDRPYSVLLQLGQSPRRSCSTSISNNIFALVEISPAFQYSHCWRSERVPFATRERGGDLQFQWAPGLKCGVCESHATTVPKVWFNNLSDYRLGASSHARSANSPNNKVANWGQILNNCRFQFLLSISKAIFINDAK